jgi:hypothetical protein
MKVFKSGIAQISRKRESGKKGVGWEWHPPHPQTSSPNGDFPIRVISSNGHVAVSFDNPKDLPFFFFLEDIFCIRQIYIFFTRKIFYYSEDIS